MSHVSRGTGAALALVAVVAACSIYANLAFVVTNPATYRLFPPFQPNFNAADGNRDLGGEYFNIARSITLGRGFADPFGHPSGPTAWMPPILSIAETGLLWVADGNRNAVAAVVVFLQVGVLIGTGLLVLELARQTTRRVGSWLAAGIFLAAVLGDFRSWFQSTHDAWFILLFVDLLIAGFCWCRPFERWMTAGGWGLFGGLAAQVNPIVGFVWFLGTALSGFRRRAWTRLAFALAAAALTLAPWTIRNYLLFGRWIPVKSNLAYELYQSQCLQSDGALRRATFYLHPHGAVNQERREYVTLGESAYLDRKRELFWQAVAAQPQDFVRRVADRFLAATLWYESFDPSTEVTWIRRLSRITHPLPFIALMTLLVIASHQRLNRLTWIVIGVYLCYLLPYIFISYYERYALPLLGAKSLLCIWALDCLPWGTGTPQRNPPDTQKSLQN